MNIMNCRSVPSENNLGPSAPQSPLLPPRGKRGDYNCHGDDKKANKKTVCCFLVSVFLCVTSI